MWLYVWECVRLDTCKTWLCKLKWSMYGHESYICGNEPCMVMSHVAIYMGMSYIYGNEPYMYGDEPWLTWVVSHNWLSHVSHMNESCLTYECVMSHICMSHVAHAHESCLTYERSCLAYEWVKSHMRMSHVTREWVMSHIWMSHVSHMNESCLTYEWVMSQVRAAITDNLGFGGHNAALVFKAYEASKWMSAERWLCGIEFVTWLVEFVT